MTPTLKQQLVDFLYDLRFFPGFLFSYVLGFFRLFLTSVDLLSLLIFAILIGIATTFVIGAATFFGGYVLTRSIDSLANSVFQIAASARFYGRE